MAVWLSGYICLISIGCDLVAHGLSPALCNNLYLIFGPPLAETQLGYGGYEPSEPGGDGLWGFGGFHLC